MTAPTTTISGVMKNVFDLMDLEASAARRFAFTHHMFESVAENSRPDGWSRGLTLKRYGIEDISHAFVIAGVRDVLRRNREVTKERGRGFLSPVGKWWLLGLLIAEGRAQRQMQTIAAKWARAS